jgi:hypothetical protein
MGGQTVGPSIVNPILTTITPYWGRPDMLRGWVRGIKAASVPEVCHLINFVGEDPPTWWTDEVPYKGDENGITAIINGESPGKSIGFYHNQGAEFARTEWIMKMDVDTLPCPSFFKALLPVLQSSPNGEWHNVGMFYLTKAWSKKVESAGLSQLLYCQTITQRGSATIGDKPGGTNFVCRRENYLRLGGSHSGFFGWGWEDYQQIHMLEKNKLGRSPLSRSVELSSVTRLCRDLIARPKAESLFLRDSRLALLHRWHLPGSTPGYKTPAGSEANKRVLLRCVTS